MYRSVPVYGGNFTGEGDVIELQINLAWAKFRAVVTDKFGTQVDRVQREASFIAALAFGEQTASFVLTRV